MYGVAADNSRFTLAGTVVEPADRLWGAHSSVVDAGAENDGETQTETVSARLNYRYG